MMTAKSYVAAMFLIIVIASDVHTAEYSDYEGIPTTAVEEDNLIINSHQGGSTSESEGENARDFYDTVQQFDDLSSAKLWDIPLEHLMVRKSQRSPSLRLRFGRRSDPLLSNDFPGAYLSQDSIERKSVRSPSYTLRFGRRSDPELSEGFMVRKASRSPSFRLRFGRRSDPLFTHDLASSFLGDDYFEKKMIRSPSYRLRFGRQSDPVDSVESQPGTASEKEPPIRVEDN